MKVDFRRLHWEDYPSEETPINADNLNRLEEGVAGLYSDMAEIEPEIQRKFERPFKIVQISDTHYGRDINNNVDWYNVTAQERMNKMVEWLKEEHNKAPIDLILHTGDITFSNLYTPAKKQS